MATLESWRMSSLAGLLRARKILMRENQRNRAQTMQDTMVLLRIQDLIQRAVGSH